MKTLVCCILLFMISSSYGQLGNEKTFIDYNNVELPEAPTASSLGEYGDTPMNTATGTPLIEIPIYTLQVDGVNVPISLSYHTSGIKVNELATAVGLNWTLNAGGEIFRSVKCKPDEDGWQRPSDDLGPIPDSFYDNYENIEEENYQIYMLGSENGSGYAEHRDHNPDNYNYSFLGFSGKYITDFYDVALKNQADNLTIHGNTIEDQMGNLYYFGQYGYTETSNRSFTYTSLRTDGGNIDYNGYSYDPNIVTGWMLSSIITKNNKTISFEYEPYLIEEHDPHTISNTIAKGAICGLLNSDYAEKTATSVFNDYTVQLISKIVSENVDIIFDYTDDGDLSLWKRELTKITINDKITGTSKEFHFEYGRYLGDHRLQLKRIYEKKGTEELPGYSFSYIEGYLPNKYSFSQDFFGYYNGKSNGSLAPKDPTIKDGYFSSFQTFYDTNTGDRSHNLNYLQIGTLDKITYPTGGSTKFTYEANSEYDPVFNKIKYCGGLRVSLIEDWNNNENPLKTTTYSYDGLEGQSFETNLEYLIKIDKSYPSGSPIKFIFNSDFIEREELNLSGYFYKTVTAVVLKDGKQQKKQSSFVENLSFGKRSYLLSTERIFSGNDTAQLVEYQYSRVGTNDVLNWNILGGMYCIPHTVFPPTAPQGYMGYGFGQHVQSTGNWAMLPTQIATTDFLKQGFTVSPVTTVQTFAYDDATLLKTTETTNTRCNRVDNNGNITYPEGDPNGEITTVNYKYPFTPEDEGFAYDFPKGLLIHKEVFSSNHGNSKIFGQAFVYDDDGNIEIDYQYNKGEGTNTSPLSYIPGDYQQMTTFLYENGKPVEMFRENGEATSYIWGYNGQFPVAKIEGLTRTYLNNALGTLVGEIESTANESALQGKLTDLRNSPNTANAMVTTYTYEPLNGVKTITDPKGDRVTYHYDSFGRLDSVKDSRSQLLLENEYNYEPIPSN